MTQMVVVVTLQSRRKEKKVVKEVMVEIKLQLMLLLKSQRKKFTSQWMVIPMMILVSLISRKK
jgi:ribosomal silencing factor RsfS